jgi:hypothetical protein
MAESSNSPALPVAEAPCLSEREPSLVRRQDLLNDEPLMKRLLEAALNEMSSQPLRVEGYQVAYCKIKPRRNINVAMELSIRPPGGADFHRQHISCTIWPTMDRGRQEFEAESAPLSLPPFSGTELFGWLRPMTFVPELAMVVRLFPVDAALRGLAQAADPQWMRSILEEHLPGCYRDGWQLRDLRYDVLHYKPRQSCALRYTLRLGHAGRTEIRTQEVYAKLYRDDRGGACYELLDAAWRGAATSGGAWRAARPVCYLPEWRLMLQEGVAGPQFRHFLNEMTHDDAGGPQLRQVEDRLVAIARALRKLQTSGIRLGRPRPWERLWGDQQHNVDHLRGVHPELAAAIDELRREISARAADCPAAPLVFAHCDFAHGNVLLDGGRIGIIDFDRAGLAEPAYDPAYFLTHLWSFGVRHPRRMRHLTPLCDAFRREFLSLAPEVDPARLALYEALDFISYVLRNFRKQSHQAQWLAWAGDQLDAARQRLACCGT